MFVLLPHVRSVYISILGERVSIPAGKYTLGWENCHSMNLKGGKRVYVLVRLWIFLVYKEYYILCDTGCSSTEIFTNL